MSTRREFLGMLGVATIVAVVPGPVRSLAAGDELDAYIAELVNYPDVLPPDFHPLPPMNGWAPMPTGKAGALVRRCHETGRKLLTEMPGLEGRVFETTILEERFTSPGCSEYTAEAARQLGIELDVGEPVSMVRTLQVDVTADLVRARK